MVFSTDTINFAETMRKACGMPFCREKMRDIVERERMWQSDLCFKPVSAILQLLGPWPGLPSVSSAIKRSGSGNNAYSIGLLLGSSTDNTQHVAKPGI